MKKRKLNLVKDLTESEVEEVVYGTGIKFPITINRNSGRAETVTGTNNLRSNVERILFMREGETVGNNGFDNSVEKRQVQAQMKLPGNKFMGSSSDIMIRQDPDKWGVGLGTEVFSPFLGNTGRLKARIKKGIEKIPGIDKVYPKIWIDPIENDKQVEVRYTLKLNNEMQKDTFPVSYYEGE